MTINIMKTFETVDDGIANMIAAANADYENFNVSDEMKAEFKEKWVIKKGSKYIKISTGGSAWGFVVNVDDDKKFKKGTLLKCAGYSSPERNGSRGNVLEGGFPINWTGPLYLVGPVGFSVKETKVGVFG
jgi:hypothetical protein